MARRSAVVLVQWYCVGQLFSAILLKEFDWTWKRVINKMKALIKKKKKPDPTRDVECSYNERCKLIYGDWAVARPPEHIQLACCTTGALRVLQCVVKPRWRWKTAAPPGSRRADRDRWQCENAPNAKPRQGDPRITHRRSVWRQYNGSIAAGGAALHIWGFLSELKCCTWLFKWLEDEINSHMWWWVSGNVNVSISLGV